ncbi:hypothetical protein PRIPAC_96307 [Pristionchus pacificus]|nr:hypothetical protein PRIPAC_96307 [Pristionchus pacificus]|eukprot:PDM83917.1 BTB domain-containing protein [Pristionchus pacificus]
MCLIVEGEPFFVGKYNLARHSHYFEVLFGRDYSENGKRQIELKEISKDEFRLFLDFIHNMGVEVDIGTVWSLLEMGRYFNAPTVMSAAEEYLTSTDNELALAESFVLADQFHLTAVMDWCMQKLTTVSQCNQVRGSERWDVLSKETKRSIDEVYSRLAPPTQTVHNYPSPFQYLQQQYIPPSFAQQWAAPNHNYTGGSGNASSLSGMMWSQMYMNHYRTPVPQLAPPPVPAPVPVAQVAQLAVPSQLVTAPGALQPQVAVPRPVKRSRKQKDTAARIMTVPTLNTTSLLYPRSKDSINVRAHLLDVNGFDWSVETIDTFVTLEDELNHCVGIKFTNMMNDKTTIWYSEATLSYKIHRSKGRSPVTWSHRCRFTPQKNTFTWNIDIREDMMDDNTYWSGDVCEIIINIEPHGEKGHKFYKRTVVDWNQNIEGADCCVEVEGEKFFVGKATLVRHSKYFDSIFFGSDEVDMTPCVLTDTSKEAFRLFLNYIHRFNDAKIDMSTVMLFIKIAKRLQSEGIMAKAEHYVVKSDQVRLPLKIDLSEMYEMPGLKDHCETLISTCSLYDINDIMAAANYSTWSSSITNLVVKRLLEIANEQKQQLDNVPSPNNNPFQFPSFPPFPNPFFAPNTNRYPVNPPVMNNSPQLPLPVQRRRVPGVVQPQPAPPHPNPPTQRVGVPPRLRIPAPPQPNAPIQNVFFPRFVTNPVPHAHQLNPLAHQPQIALNPAAVPAPVIAPPPVAPQPPAPVPRAKRRRANGPTQP